MMEEEKRKAREEEANRLKLKFRQVELLRERQRLERGRRELEELSRRQECQSSRQEDGQETAVIDVVETPPSLPPSEENPEKHQFLERGRGRGQGRFRGRARARANALRSMSSHLRRIWR